MSTPTLIGIPGDASPSFLEGAAGAPPCIRQTLWSPAGNLWSELGIDIEPQLDDAGDVSFEPGRDPRAVVESAIADARTPTARRGFAPDIEVRRGGAADTVLEEALRYLKDAALKRR